MVLFTVTDKVTTEGMLVRSILVGVELPSSPDETILVLRDWEALEKLNTLAEGRGYRRARESMRTADPDAVMKGVEEARAAVESRLPSLQLPFRLPDISLSAVLWPDSSLVSQGIVEV
jgi:hypothetical protein